VLGADPLLGYLSNDLHWGHRSCQLDNTVSSRVFLFIGLSIYLYIYRLDVAYALVLGLLFAWMLVSGIISYFLVHFALQRELRWWRSKYSPPTSTTNYEKAMEAKEYDQRERKSESVPEVRVDAPEQTPESEVVKERGSDRVA